MDCASAGTVQSRIESRVLPRPARTILLAATLVWLLLVGTGLKALWSYSLAPGEGGRTPELWPAESRLPPPARRPNLVVLAHPQCACSRATVGELALLMARVHDRVSAHVLFLEPEGADESWVKSDLWERAAAIPGVTVWKDEGGRESERFGAATSGQTVLYDRDGRLRFSGGITAARGHSGDNAGRSTLTALLLDGAAGRPRTPVFGCSLHEPGAPCAGEANSCKSL
ncbi:MAG: RedB protein [Candidatus Binatia bacterium]